jgi:hypothetical protein
MCVQHRSCNDGFTADMRSPNFSQGGFKFGRKHRSHALIEVVDGKDVQTIVRGGAGEVDPGYETGGDARVLLLINGRCLIRVDTY